MFGTRNSFAPVAMMGADSARCQRLCFRRNLACIAICPIKSPQHRIRRVEGVAMTYAPADRAFYDADSHIMELPDFLLDYADPDVRDEIPPVNYSASIVTDEEVAEIVAQRRATQRRARRRAARARRRADREFERDPGARRVRFERAHHCARHARLQAPTGVRHAQRRGAVLAEFEDDAGRPLRIGARTQPRDGRLLRATMRDCMGVGVVPLDDPTARDRGTRARARARTEGRVGAAPSVRRQGRPVTSISIRSGRASQKRTYRSCCTSAARRCS